MLHPTIAKRRKTRIAMQLHRQLARLMTRLPECEWVLGYRYLGQSKTIAQHEWHAIASTEGLVQTVLEKRHVLDAVLENDHLLQSSSSSSSSSSCPAKPRDSTVRASMVRRMLRRAWADHVRGTPFQDSVQMYSLVERGAVDAFPWWHHVVGRHIPFKNTSVNIPEVSSALWDHLIARERTAAN